MTDTPERALLRLHTQGTAGEGDLLVHVSDRSRCGDITDGVACEFENRRGSFVVARADLLVLARALLAEPEGEEPTLRSMAGAAPDLTGGVESVEWLRRKRAAMEDNYAAYATPRSRAEGSDLSVDQGREFRVVDGLGDSNRAGKVTIDPTLLSPPTPRPRAEAEAMVAGLQRYELEYAGPAYHDLHQMVKDETGDWVQFEDVCWLIETLYRKAPMTPAESATRARMARTAEEGT